MQRPNTLAMGTSSFLAAVGAVLSLQTQGITQSNDCPATPRIDHRCYLENSSINGGLGFTLSQASSTAAAAASSSFKFGQRSETWRQGTGGIPGAPENGLLIPTGQGVSVYQRGDEFGKAVATGDFNGDGYVDLVIGSPGENSQKYSDDSGKGYDDYEYNGLGGVTIIYGSATGLSNNPKTFWVDGAISFGRSLAAGDFNRDGKMDLAVGTRSGLIYIYNGSDTGLQQSSMSLGSGSHALATGDFNGDGTTDLAASNPFGSVEQGSVAIFHGAANGSLTNVQTWSQDSPGIEGVAEGISNPAFNSSGTWGDRFGFSLAAGDFDGDGKDDLAIGTPGERFFMGGISNVVSAGAVNILYGSGSGLTANKNQFWDQNGTEGAQFNLEGGIEANDYFGYAVAAGDFNKDGVADLAIGVPGEDDDAGAVAILYGKRDVGLTNEGNQLIDQNSPGMAGGAEEGDRFGESLRVGDFDNGVTDLVVGIPNEAEGSARGGAVALILGVTGEGFARRLNVMFDQRQVTGAKLEDADLFSEALAAGDFNGDGSDDLAIGAPGEKSGSGLFNHAGEVNVLYGENFFRTVFLGSSGLRLDEITSASGQFSFNAIDARYPITIKSVGTAKLGVDFTVGNLLSRKDGDGWTHPEVTVNGDFITLQLPGKVSGPGVFRVTVINDNLSEGTEFIEFVVVKRNGYNIKPTNKASLPIKDSTP